jgi:putative transposase
MTDAHSVGMPNYRRLQIPGATYFFTVNLQDRSARLLVEHVQALRRAFEQTRLARPFDLVAIAVLPDHLHCLWTLPPGDGDNASRWRQIKSTFSRAIATTECRSISREQRRERGLWQHRFWARWIGNESDLHAHIDYIHRNPMKHGHVEHVRDWPYSSFHRYVRDGLVAADWGG